MTLGCVLGEIKANLHSWPSAAALQNCGPANGAGRDQGANHASLASGRWVGEAEEVSARTRRGRVRGRRRAGEGHEQDELFLPPPFFYYGLEARSHVTRTSAGTAVT